MKFLQKLSGAAMLLSALLFTACSKDKDPGNAVTPDAWKHLKPCRLIKALNDNYYVTYIYDNKTRVIRIDQISRFDSTLIGGHRYSYNAAGKATEEIRFSADSTIVSKKQFTYNSNNLLTQIDFYESTATGGPVQLSGYTLFKHNAAGQRILMQEYSGTQPGTLYSYTQYAYKQNCILAKTYNPQTTPATLYDSVECHFDKMKSVNSELGYLNEYWPETDKHNIIAVKSSNGMSSFHYEYNDLGYPVRMSYPGMNGYDYVTYEYDCQ